MYKLINVFHWKHKVRKACQKLKKAVAICLACRGGLSLSKLKK